MGRTPLSRPSFNDPRVQRVLEWLLTPPSERTPSRQSDLAAELGIGTHNITQWRNDPDFLAEWERQYRKTVGSPDRQKSVLDALFETATDRTDPRQVPAARAYLEAIDVVKPKKLDVTVTKGAVKELTDDELMGLLAERAEAELSNRSDG
jgi:hypothetical protein